MAAAPCRALIQQGGSLEEFGEKTLPLAASIDSVRSIGSAATLDIPGHEARCMACSILADSKAVNSFPHILPAEIRIAACDPLAFDDRMRIVIFEAPEDLEQKNRNVSPPIEPIKVPSRTRPSSRKYDHRPVPTVRSVIHCAARRSPQPFGAIHLVVVRSDAAGGQLTGLDRPQDCGGDVGAKVDRGADEGGVRWDTWTCRVPSPEKLLATTALASSKARTPIQ